MKTRTLNTSSPLSSVTVSLKPSRDYLRILILVHGFAVMALLQTACPRGLIATLTCVLAAHGSYLWRRQTPGARCSELNYVKACWWVLDDTTGELVVYDEACVRFDFGWLMWLVFKNTAKSNTTPRRDIILFQDQITPDEHRLLRLVLRVNTVKTVKTKRTKKS